MKRPLLGALIIGSLAVSACGKEEDKAAGSPSTEASAAASPSAAPSATPSTAPVGTGLDSAFGTGGFAKVPMAGDAKDRFSAIAVGGDGKLYAAGLTSKGTDQEIAVARFDTDGKPDTSFGSNGVASFNVSKNPEADATKQLEQARSLVVQPDGKIVVVGTAEHSATGEYDRDDAAAAEKAKDTDIVAVRFDSAGKPDTGFGDGGAARLDLGTGHKVDEETYAGADQGYGSAALPDGGIVIFGNTAAGADRADSDFALVALTGAGVLDKSFGTDGVTRIDLDSSGDSARHVRVVGDKIIATGYARGADKVVQPVLVRTSLDGKRDASFGTYGVARHKILNAVTESYAFGIQRALDGGDKYVLTGYGKDADPDKVDLVAYRFTAKGELDKTFGTDGVTRIDNAGDDDRGRNLVVLPDNRILYVGSGKPDATNIQAMVVVLSADGAPEPAYGAGGRILTDFGSNGDSWYGVTLSPDGKTAYLAGYTNAAPEDTKGDDAVLGRLKLG